MAIRKQIMNKEGKNVRARHTGRDQAAELLASGMPPIEVAKKVCVHPTTIYKWIQEPEIQARIEEHRSLSLLESSSRVGEMIKPALECIMDAIKAGDAKASLDFLKLCGAIQTAGNTLGMHADNYEENMITVVINTSGRAMEEVISPVNTIDVVSEQDITDVITHDGDDINDEGSGDKGL